MFIASRNNDAKLKTTVTIEDEKRKRLLVKALFEKLVCKREIKYLSSKIQTTICLSIWMLGFIIEVLKRLSVTVMMNDKQFQQQLL